MEYVSRKPLPNETATDYAMLGGAEAERGRKLFQTGLALLVLALGYLGYTSRAPNPMLTACGLLIFTLSVLPSLLWARTGGSRFPVFETILLLCANTYAMPVFNAQEQLLDYSPEVIAQACFTVLLYQITAITVYQITRGVPGRSSFWRDSLISNKLEELLIYGLVLSTLYMWASNFTGWIPRELDSVLRAVFYGLSILCTFVSCQRWGRGELTTQSKIIIVLTVVPQLIFMSVGLILISAIGQAGIALLAYLSGGRRIPWIAVAVTFVVFAVLHTGKTKMRSKYWDLHYPPPTGLTDLPAYYSEWVAFGLEPTDGGKTVSQKMLERTSLMHILCLIADCTPARQDYLYGKTYAYVLPQLIPRAFWADKPKAHIATYTLSIYYGLQMEEDTATTSIAFGLVAEAYANFGLLGAVALGAFWGFWLKKLQIWSTFSPIFSFAGLFMVLLTAWSFASELTMASWVSSLEQAVLVVLGVPMIVRSLFGD